MKFKRIIGILMTTLMISTLVECGENTLTSATEEYFDSLVAGKENDVKDMVTDALNKSIFGDISATSEEVQSGITEETKKILDEIVGKMAVESSI